MAYAADLCGSKLKAKLSSTINEAQATPISSKSFAAKQMSKMGWKEGTGLGKNSDGITSYIKMKQREENIGLGIEKSRTKQLGREGMWWSSNVSQTLLKLQLEKKRLRKNSKKENKTKSKKKPRNIEKKRKADDESQEHQNLSLIPQVYTDEELLRATGGSRFGMRTRQSAEGKSQRTEALEELKILEKSASQKIEWNGLGKAKTVLNENFSANKNEE